MTLDAGALEQAGQDAAVRRAVVDDQSGERLAGREPGVERRHGGFEVVDAPSASPACPGRSGSVNQNRLPSPSDALDLQLAAHLRDQMIADGETQARAAGRGAGLGLREGGEDLRQRLRLDAGAGVADLEAQMRPRPRG